METSNAIQIPDKYESDELGELFTALAKAQLEMEVAKTDSTNPFFKSKYADLPSIVRASRKYLAVNGLSVVQRFIPLRDGAGILTTRLGHSSGQWMESRINIRPAKDDIQTFGSYSTYLKRYSYAAITGVVAADEDDDGENAMYPARTQEKAKKENPKISLEQTKILGKMLEGREDWINSIFKKHNIGKLSDLPSAWYTPTINQLKQMINATEA